MFVSGWFDYFIEGTIRTYMDTAEMSEAAEEADARSVAARRGRENMRSGRFRRVRHGEGQRTRNRVVRPLADKASRSSESVPSRFTSFGWAAVTEAEDRQGSNADRARRNMAKSPGLAAAGCEAEPLLHQQNR